MRNNRLSDADVEALLNGTAPAGRGELEPVAAFVEDLRIASFESAPRPSAALSARLGSASWISPAVGGLRPVLDREAASAFAAPLPHRGRVRMIFSWFTGLGLAAKIAIGATVMAVGAVGAGAAQALPTPVQQSFNEIVGLAPETDAPAVEDSGADSTDTTDDTATVPDPAVEDGTPVVDPTVPVVGDDDGTADQGKTDHATAVTEAAHDDSTEGREHGEAVSDAAHQNRGQGGSSDDSAEHESGDDDSAGEVESGDDNGADDSGDDSGSHGGSDSGNSGKGSSDSGHGGGKGKN